MLRETEKGWDCLCGPAKMQCLPSQLGKLTSSQADKASLNLCRYAEEIIVLFITSQKATLVWVETKLQQKQVKNMFSGCLVPLIGIGMIFFGIIEGEILMIVLGIVLLVFGTKANS